MRELRFRAWVYYDEKLEKPHYSRDYGSLSRFFEDHDENDDKQCIEQYVGLKDKNGKEIYEGDILLADDWADDAYYRVIYDELRAGYVAQSVTESRKDDPFAGYFGRYLVNHCKVIDHCKVIGNIHEKPELLEGKDGKCR